MSVNPEFMVFDTPEGIEYYKLCAMEYALKLQGHGITGMRFPRGRTPLQILRKDYGLPVRTIADGLEVIPYLIVARRRLAKGPLIRGTRPSPAE